MDVDSFGRGICDGNSLELKHMLRQSKVQTVLPLIVVRCTCCVLAQTAPAAPNHPWHVPEQRDIGMTEKQLSLIEFALNSVKTYSLAVISHTY